MAIGSAWKLPPERTSPLASEDDRVVGNGVRLDFERARDEAQRVEAGAHHLRLAAQRVRILDAVAVAMRRHDCASKEQVAEDAGDVDLSGVAAHGVDARVERRISAFRRLDRHRAGDDGGGEDVLSGEQPGESERRRHLRAVDEGETLLRPEDDRGASQRRPGPRAREGAGRDGSPRPCRSGWPTDGRAALDRPRRRPTPCPARRAVRRDAGALGGSRRCRVVLPNSRGRARWPSAPRQGAPPRHRAQGRRRCRGT